MRSTSRVTASAVVGGLALLCLPVWARAQAVQLRPVTHVASLAAGSIQGTVQDEKGAPVAGAMVSALGSSTAFAVTDRGGRFELRTLTPGPYLVRAHLSGFVASRGQVVDVHPSARSSSSIALRHANVATSATAASYPVLAAGVGASTGGGTESASQPDTSGGGATTGSTSDTDGDDHREIAWRLRHARRSILKDATLPIDALAGETPVNGNPFDTGFLDRTVNSSARLASNFFTDTPFSGQVNLLTTGSFDAPQQMFTVDNLSRSIAYLAVGAPVGNTGDWTMRAALTQGDVSSWIVAGDYATRAPATHRYDFGFSYAAQRYGGADFVPLQSVTDGSRNAGMMYGFDTYSITPIVTLTYGARYAHYDYLANGGLMSPRVSLTVEPADHFRISTMLSSRAAAPGAEEFLPRSESSVWLPAQLTFSALTSDRPLEAERTNHMEVEVEHDLAAATVSLRAFRQHVSDQLVTLFGVDMPDAPAAALGHYFMTNVGDVQASGLSAGVRAAIAGRFHGSVEYSVSQASFNTPGSDYLLVLAPSALRIEPERIHDVSTSIETDVPETATRVVVLYRVSDAFARPASSGTTPGLDSRFDVQVRQSLPFMDFSSARWEMLVAVRNFFRETAPDQSIYDELLVVRPPKRLVGGLTLKF
jgi:hypothetical protein